MMTTNSSASAKGLQYSDADRTAFIENGIIESADIVFSRGFALDCWLTLTFDGTGQGFGGYVLGGNPFDDALCARHGEQPNIAADFIGGVMAVAGVEKFSQLVGKVIRVRRADKYGSIDAIGHPVKDLWYEPKERLTLLSGKSTEGESIRTEGEVP